MRSAAILGKDGFSSSLGLSLKNPSLTRASVRVISRAINDTSERHRRILTNTSEIREVAEGEGFDKSLTVLQFKIISASSAVKDFDLTSS